MADPNERDEMKKKAAVGAQDEMADMSNRRMQADALAIMAEHTLTETETLSHLALKYYGNADRPYWMVIYEANKDVIGPNPALVRVGMKLRIPALPDELKKK